MAWCGQWALALGDKLHVAMGVWQNHPSCNGWCNHAGFLTADFGVCAVLGGGAGGGGVLLP